MDKRPKKPGIFIAVILVLLITPLAVGYYVMFCPHTTHFFFNREKLENEFSLSLTDDVKLISYRDESIMIAITTELIVEVDDAEEFIRRNIKCEVEPFTENNFDHKYGGNRRIYIKIEPLEDKYRVHLRHME